MGRYVDSTEQLVVELLVRDVPRSVAFYRDLGFAVLRADDHFAVVTWEDHRLFLARREGLTEPPAIPVMNVRVMVPDVDRVWQRINELGVRVAAAIEDRTYGLRDFTIVDPDGFGIRFGTRLPVRA
jgi:catechol 2,3-dioxygenase-like lactoylglutathione lyase family enzyme